jgi:hypothetical protein
MKRSALVLASVTVFLMLGGFLYPAPAHSPGGAPAPATSNSYPTSNIEIVPHEGGFDLQSCETNCRSYYGIPPYLKEQGAGGGGASSDSNSRYLIIAHCIEQCQKRFWKEFDKNMKDLDRPSSP